MKNKSILFLLLAALSLPALADNIQLTSVGTNGEGGVATYPYYFTTNVDGVTKSNVALMCVDYNREINVNEKWEVTPTAIPTDTSTLSQEYRALALIDYGLLNGIGGYSSNTYQFAAWDIFDSADVNANTNFNSAEKSNASTIASYALSLAGGSGSLPSGFSYSNYMLYIPTSNQTGWTLGPPQRFIGAATPEFRAEQNPPVSPSPTPEPSSLMLMGTGIFGVAGAMYRRVKAAAAPAV